MCVRWHIADVQDQMYTPQEGQNALSVDQVTQTVSFFFKQNSLFPPFHLEEDTPGTRGPGPSTRGPGLRHVCVMSSGLWVMVELKFGMSRRDCCLFCQQNKKGGEPRVNNVTIKLWWPEKPIYPIPGNVSFCFSFWNNFSFDFWVRFLVNLVSVNTESTVTLHIEWWRRVDEF